MIFVTNHAMEQGKARCGMSPRQIIEQVQEALDIGKYYEHTQKERWIAVEGIDGKGTAIAVYQNGIWDIVTIRDANIASQGERAREKLTAKLLELNNKKPAVSFSASPGVLIRIQGDNRIILSSGEVKDDGGLISNFLDWCWKSGITPLLGSSSKISPGEYSCMHTMEDAEKITAWLKEQGAHKKDISTLLRGKK